MKESERDDEASDSDEPSPVVFTKRIDASESILKLTILVLISVLSFRYGSLVSTVRGCFSSVYIHISKHFHSDS